MKRGAIYWAVMLLALACIGPALAAPLLSLLVWVGVL